MLTVVMPFVVLLSSLLDGVETELDALVDEAQRLPNQADQQPRHECCMVGMVLGISEGVSQEDAWYGIPTGPFAPFSSNPDRIGQKCETSSAVQLQA
jgi:hypothetical protein